MSPSPRLEALTDRVLQAILEHEPVEATGLGLHESDHRLPDVSVTGWRRYGESLHGLLDAAIDIPAEDLSSSEKIDRELLISHLKVRLHELEDRRFPQRNPTWYTNLLTHSVFLLLLRDFAPMEQRLEAIASRMEQMPSFLAEAMLLLDKPSQIALEVAREDIEGALDFFHSTFPVLAEQYPAVGPRLLSANLKAIRAMSAFGDFLQRDLSGRTVKEFAVGRDSFEYLLRHRHRIPDTPEELTAFGREELDRTLRAMDRLARDAGEPGWEEMAARIQSHHPSSGELMKAYEETLQRAKAFMTDRGLATIPRAEELEIIETPNFLQHVVPFAAYYPPAQYEEKQKGFFLVTAPPDDENRAARLCGHNYSCIALTTIHEAFPGHHLQLTVSNRSGSRLRKLADNSMFAEGWALYCEELMYEAGFYDRKTRLLQLKDLVWRACRVIIDVGLHTGTMTFEQAVDMLCREAKLDRHSAVAEVKWYSLAPTYPLSYLRGKREILRLRDRWRERGPYDPKAFHDALLAAGTLPMELAERHLFD